MLTSKHHDGFELWPSPNAFNWNAMDVGPKKDLVGAFLSAMRDTGIHAGLYHSVFECKTCLSTSSSNGWAVPMVIGCEKNGCISLFTISRSKAKTTVARQPHVANG